MLLQCLFFLPFIKSSSNYSNILLTGMEDIFSTHYFLNTKYCHAPHQGQPNYQFLRCLFFLEKTKHDQVKICILPHFFKNVIKNLAQILKSLVSLALKYKG